MSEQTLQLVFALGIPFLSLVLCWGFLMLAMHKTTGELKHWLTPDNLIKSIAISFIVISILALAVLRILESSVIGTILSGIVGYTLGTSFMSLKDK